MNLADLLTELRTDYREEARLKHLVSAQPPVTRWVDTSVDANGEAHFIPRDREDDADQTGMNLSGALVALIGNVQLDTSFYGPRHPIRSALSAWERKCRRDHRQVPGRAPMWTDHDLGPVCGVLLWAAVRDEASVAYLAELHEIAYPRVERILWRGIEYVQRYVARLEAERDKQPIASESSTSA